MLVFKELFEGYSPKNGKEMEYFDQYYCIFRYVFRPLVSILLQNQPIVCAGS